MPKELNWNGTEIGAKASNVKYNNSSSGMEATNVQQAIDELKRTGGSGGGGSSYAPFNGKTLATLGDSFSEPAKWQTMMMSQLHFLRLKNLAVSGGRWCKNGNWSSAYEQALSLAGQLSECDYILACFGTNDVAGNTSLGNIVNTENISNLDLTTITGGMQACLITLKNAFPDAIIKIGYTPAGYIHDSFESISAANTLCERMKEVANYYGVGYIETRACGICPYMASDAAAYVSGGHPNNAGHARIGEYMARMMMGNL